MSVQHAEAVIAATHKVHDEVWFRYWREGKKELTPRQVIDLIRDVRVKARIDEDALPEELLELLAAARIARGEKGTIRLAKLIEALKLVYLPPPAKL